MADLRITTMQGADTVLKATAIEAERLVALKNKYDPTNFFRLNQNIKPRRCDSKGVW